MWPCRSILHKQVFVLQRPIVGLKMLCQTCLSSIASIEYGQCGLDSGYHGQMSCLQQLFGGVELMSGCRADLGVGI